MINFILTSYFSPTKIDLELKSCVEQMVMKWLNQIDEVLNRDSANVLDGESYPTPTEGNQKNPFDN